MRSNGTTMVMRTMRSDSKRRALPAGARRLLAGALSGRNHFAHQSQFGLVDRGRFDDHHQRPDRRIELARDVALKLRELNEVGESLLAEINAVRIDDEFERA